MRVIVAIALIFALSSGLVMWCLQRGAEPNPDRVGSDTPEGGSTEQAIPPARPAESQKASQAAPVIKPASYRIEGTVVDENGEPIRGASVYSDADPPIDGNSASSPNHLSETDTQGRFVFPYRKMEVEFYAFFREQCSGTASLKSGGLNIILWVPDQVVIGRVTVSSELRGYACVELRGDSHLPHCILRPSRETGVIRSASLPAGNYRVLLRIGERIVRSFIAEVGREGATGELDLGELIIPLSYRLGRVTVLAPDGKPAADYPLQLTDTKLKNQLGRVQTQRTDQHGVAQFIYDSNGLPVLSSKTGWMLVRRAEAADFLVMRPSFPVTVQLEAASRFEITFEPDIPRDLRVGRRIPLRLRLISTQPEAQERRAWRRAHGFNADSRWGTEFPSGGDWPRTSVSRLPKGQYRLEAIYLGAEKDWVAQECIDLGTLNLVPEGRLLSAKHKHKLTPAVLERLRAAAARN